MNRSSTFVLGAVLGFGPVAAFAVADSAPIVAAEETRIEGTVKSVDAKAGTFVITSGGKDISVRTDKETKYKHAGKDAKMEDVVKVGEKVKVTHKDGLASKVEVVKKDADKPKDPAKPKDPSKPGDQAGR